MISIHDRSVCFASLTKKSGIRIHQVVALTTFDKLHLLTEKVRQPGIISIEKSNELTARGPQTSISRSTRAAVLLL
jgi:hypothetical protein